ncbi:MAG: esterase/lipase family protein [Phycisphaeraceae bacterium]
MNQRGRIGGALCLLLCVWLSACRSEPRPDLGAIYNEPAQRIGAQRNPVIVIPGILGSKLEEPGLKTPVWGAFTYGAADPDTVAGARLVALPMEKGKPLSELRDTVVPTTVLDTLELDVALVVRGLEIAAYDEIIRTLAAGAYRDETLALAGAVDYGGLHFTCFQYAYDWRRDIAEQAAALHQRVLAAQQAAQDGHGLDQPPRVDVVAHSMGGLVLRYYLRYGPQPLPDDGSLPELNWAGARNVETAIIIGTPSAGSVLSLKQLVEGVNYVGLITPTYRPAVLGSMPSIYQLLPRVRHARVIDEATGELVDFLDPKVWKQYGWGLADPDDARTRRWLLPDAEDDAERAEIAYEHLEKCLARADQLFRALDAPATDMPAGVTTRIVLYAGDAHDTADVLSVNPETGKLTIQSTAPGDGTVTRHSALMDERVGGPHKPRLRSPVRWDAVQFIPADHIGLTSDPAFSDNVLYELLERPR